VNRDRFASSEKDTPAVLDHSKSKIRAFYYFGDSSEGARENRITDFSNQAVQTHHIACSKMMGTLFEIKRL
jgi:hypothetical protein